MSNTIIKIEKTAKSNSEVSAYATWEDGWLNFNGYGCPGDFGDGTSVYHLTFDIYTSTRFSK